MASIRELLHRFQPAGTPGGAGGAAVPVDAGARDDAELAPVFDALGSTHQEAAGIRAQADALAAGLRQAASATAERVVTAARAGAEKTRVDVFTAARTRALAADDALVEAARRDADGIRRRAAERQADIVTLIVKTALDTVHAGAGGDAR